MVRVAAASISGLTCTIRAPRRCAAASGVSILGALEAALTPKRKSASAASQSFRSTVPLPVPSDAVSARPLASWHMLEQSGRLLVPSSRAMSW